MNNAASILSISTAHPPHRLAREEWLSVAGRIAPPSVDRAVLARLADRSGIDARWCAAFEEDRGFFYGGDEIPGTAARMGLWLRAAKAMGREACTQALARANVAADRVTHVVTASCTGFAAPSVDAHLIESLGLPRHVQRLNVGFMGCHAAVNALAAARNAVHADPRAVVLVCCTEVSSAHFHHTARLDQLIANTLFADGAAAAVVAASDGAANAPTLAATHSVLIPDTANEMGWLVGDRGFEMTLGARVPEVLEREVGAWVAGALAQHGLAIADVGAWAIHPGGPRVIDAVCAALALDPREGDASRAILRGFGNMSSATLLFILEQLQSAGTPRPWVGLAFGPGLVGEMVLVR
jgi:predicted naringenin-chalcone synthase